MIELTSPQYQFIARVFENETYGRSGDLDTTFEVIGEGLDANLIVRTTAYESPYGVRHFFIVIKLDTYIDGELVSNDFDPEIFKNLID